MKSYFFMSNEYITNNNKRRIGLVIAAYEDSYAYCNSDKQCQYL